MNLINWQVVNLVVFCFENGLRSIISLGGLIFFTILIIGIKVK